MPRIPSTLTRLVGHCHHRTSPLPLPTLTPFCTSDHRLCKSKSLSKCRHQTFGGLARCQSYSSSSSNEKLKMNRTGIITCSKVSRNFVDSVNEKMFYRDTPLHNHELCRRYSTDGNEGVNSRCFEGVRDRFNGVWVDLGQCATTAGEHEGITAESFDSMLSSSLEAWRSENVSSVWIKVPISMSHVIPVASRHRFEYHHAEGKMAVLCLWLDESVASRIPRFATHQIGVSGVVIDQSRRQVLVVKDKNKKYNVWKFPGGLSDLGEDIEFKSILAFRQQHNQRNAFGRSDIYILCRLKPMSFEIIPCQEEIEAAQWMAIDKLLHHQETSAFARQMTRLVVKGLDRGFQHVDVTANWTKSVFKTDLQLFHRPLVEDA